jgi:hypothetical protein
VDREAEKDSEAVIVTFSDTKYATMAMSEQRKQLPVYKHSTLWDATLFSTVHYITAETQSIACGGYRNRDYISSGKLSGLGSCWSNRIWKNNP